jgi:hypothetical protein
MPPGTKDASHPDFASQARLPPSGPSKRDPYLGVARGPSSYRPGPQSPPLMSPSPLQHRPTPLHPAAQNGNATVQLALAPDASNDAAAQIQHVCNLCWNTTTRPLTVDHLQERMLEERARASQRSKRAMSRSPPPAKRNRGGGPSQGFSKQTPRGVTGPNSVPMSNVRPFGKPVEDEDQVGCVSGADRTARSRLLNEKANNHHLESELNNAVSPSTSASIPIVIAESRPLPRPDRTPPQPS